MKPEFYDIDTTSLQQSLSSSLKAELSSEGLSNGGEYEESQIKPPLLRFLKMLDSIASEVCKPYTAFGLLCALQHNVPEWVATPQEGFEPDAQTLFNDAAALAFRFGSSARSAMVSFTPADYAEAQGVNDRSWMRRHLEVTQKIYDVAGAIDNTVKNLRVLGKGAKAHLDLSAQSISQVVIPECSAEFRQRMTEYDERLIQNQSILISYGLPFSVSEPSSPLKGVVVHPNWPEYKRGDLDPEPMARVFDMEMLYFATTLHAEEIMRHFDTRVYVEDLFVFLATLLKPLVDRALQGSGFGGQGYTFCHEDEIIDYVVSEAPHMYAACHNHVFSHYRDAFVAESVSTGYWQRVIRRLLDFTVQDFASRDSIDTQIFRPKKFAYRCEDGTVFFHLGSVLQFLTHLWDGFQRTGQAANTKGKLFEKSVLTVLESEEGFYRVWDTGRKLDFRVGHKMKTDVDVFIRRKEIGFLISCKSYGVNRRLELGDGQSWWKRSEDAKAWLRFAHETAKTVAEHHEELGLPPELKVIHPLVCTGWPEYLFEPYEDYSFQNGMPRIATLNEILSFFKDLNDAKAANLISDPWAVEIL